MIWGAQGERVREKNCKQGWTGGKGRGGHEFDTSFPMHGQDCVLQMDFVPRKGNLPDGTVSQEHGLPPLVLALQHLSITIEVAAPAPVVLRAD